MTEGTSRKRPRAPQSERLKREPIRRDLFVQMAVAKRLLAPKVAAGDRTALLTSRQIMRAQALLLGVVCPELDAEISALAGQVAADG